MSINDKKEKINNKSHFSNKQKTLINLHFPKKNFHKFSFPKIKKLLSHKSKYKTENEDLNDYSYSIKKTISSLNSNNEIIKSKDPFSKNRNLINKNKIGKLLNSKQLQKEKLSTSINKFKTLNKSVGTQYDHSIDHKNNKFPEINSNINKNIINISLYNTKYETFRRQSLPQNIFLPTNFSNIINQKSKRLKSSGSNEFSSIEKSTINNKCNYLVLKYNEKEMKNKKKYEKIDVDKIINIINAFLIPKEKTFENLEILINDRIKNKESLKNIDESFLINQNYEFGNNKIIEIIYKDIIKKIYKQMLKKGIKLNSKINKDEIKNEYNNQINNLKEYLDILENNKQKNFLYYQTSSTNRVKKNKKKIKITLKKSKDKKLDIRSYLFKNDENNKTSKIIYNENINKNQNKNKSCDNILFHYYNFDKATNEIIKQNLLKEKINKNYNSLYAIPINNEYIKKLKFKNSFINKCIYNIKNKDKKRKNNDQIQEFNKILMNSERFSKNNTKTSVKCLFNKISISKEKEDINLNPLLNSQNYDNIIKNKKNNIEEKNNENNENNKLNLNISDRNNVNFLNDIYNNKKMNKFKLVYKNEKIQDKIYFNKKYQSGIFSEKRDKKFNKNGDILKLIQNKKEEGKIDNKEEQNKIKNYSKIKLSKSNINELIKEEKYVKNNNKIENNSQTDSDFNDSSLSDSNYINKENKANNKEIINKKNIKDKNKKDKEDKTSKINNINKQNKSNILIYNSISRFHSLNEKKGKIIRNNIKNNIKNNIEKRIKRFNSISFLSKNYKHNFNRESFSFNDFSQKSQKQSINYMINKNIKFNKSYTRHRTIAQNYVQLFFKDDKKNNNIFKNKISVKMKFHKRQSKQEVTFKDFFKQEEGEELIENNENDKNESESIKDEEEFKENNWEAKFNIFKDYIQKLKKMSDEEFIEDTLKFIKKGEY